MLRARPSLLSTLSIALAAWLASTGSTGWFAPGFGGPQVPATAAPGSSLSDEPAAPGRADLVALIDGELGIARGEYQDYLLELYGRGPLQDLIYLKLLQRELLRLGLEVDLGAVDASVQQQWDDLLQVRHGGDLEALERELSGQGYDGETYRAALRARERLAAHEALLVERTREVDDERLAERFALDYGADGVRVELRHLFLNRARTRADALREGADPATLSNDELDRRMRERALALLAEVRAGADFETLARTHSHDLSARQNGGLIPGYDHRRYGESLAEAVRAAEVGVVGGPVATASGLHLFEVLSRTQTRLEDVREELRLRLLAEPASWKERTELRARLFDAADVQTF
jgi:peptidyl-prolyl cis-trans isomerase SurA